jgi:D-alanine-D-alanine ligase
MKKPNVLVLEGGSSNEREISFRSAEAVVVGLKKSDFTVTRFDTKSGFGGILSKETEVVFPILHGAAGEDGSVQRFLEDHNLSFLGSSSESSKLCFDKSAFKKLMKQSGILTPNWEIANINYLDNSELVDNPFVLKPISGGSSIDTYIVRHAEDMKNIPKDIFDSYPEMLLEKLI